MVHCFVDEDAMQWLKGSLSQLILYDLMCVCVCEQDAGSRWSETVSMNMLIDLSNLI